jgi:TrmH family RNA methyltransferase
MSQEDRIVVVLVRPETPGNVGFVARAMANFGTSKLRIVGDDPRYDDDAQRYSMHAVDILERAQIFPTLKAAISDMPATWAATARSGGTHSVTRALTPLHLLPDPNSLDGQIALVFGRESSGLTNEEVALCDLAFTIPVAPGYPSINLSHAVSIVLYDLFVRYGSNEASRVPRLRPATKRERDQACIFFDELVDELSIPDHRRPIAKRVFRNLLGRAYMTGREITTMIGTVRTIRDRLHANQDQSVP